MLPTLYDHQIKLRLCIRKIFFATLLVLHSGFIVGFVFANEQNANLSSGKKNPTSAQDYPTYSNNQILPYETGGGYINPSTQNPSNFDLYGNHSSTGFSGIENTDSMFANPTENQDIWQRIKDGYAIPEANSSLVKRHEKAFTAKPSTINNIVERSQKYLYHIVEEVQSRGMPTEIALLPMIESAYNPNAYSSAKASGIWQFMPSTGKNFGLKQNWWVDNRRNITFATDAALSYLQKLHVMFGTWDLALAAYNAGEGTVKRAIDKNRRLGKPTNYENLDLPKETKNYVPKLQAIKNIMTNPANYGLTIKPIENKAYFTTVTAPNQIDAKLVAELAEISYEEFIALNPGYNRPVIATKEDTQELLLPVDAVEKFHQNLATYDKPLVNWKPYKTKPGELLSTIATQHDIPLEKLRKINQLPAQKKFTKSTIILVPNKNALENVASVAPAMQPASLPITVANSGSQSPAQNLSEENATEFTESPTLENNEDLTKLQNAGNIEPNKLDEMQNLSQAELSSSGKNLTSKINYTVKKGDTLEKIAKKYKVSSKSITNINHLKKNQVKVGQKLVIQTGHSSEKANKNNVKKLKNSKSTGKKPSVKATSKKSAKTKNLKNAKKQNTSTK
jgi:membrane-bound lytic murein transglycosylase D